MKNLENKPRTKPKESSLFDKIIQTRFNDPALEAMLNSSFEHVTEKVRLSAEIKGRNNFPLVSGDQIAPYFEEFFFECQHLIDKVNSKLQFQTTCFEVTESDKATNDEVRPIENEITRTRELLIPVEIELKNMPPPANRNRVRNTRIAILIICLFDATLTSSVFQQWGYTLIESTIMGCLFGGVLAIFSHVVPYFIDMGKTMRQKKIIAAGILIAMTVLYTFFAISRAHFLTTILHDSNVEVDVSPWPFVLISDFLFVTAVGVYLKYMPSKAERESALHYDRLIEQQNVLQNKITSLREIIADAENNRLSLRLSNSSIVVYGNTLEKRIIHFAQKEFSHFKNENVMHRTDGVKPDCYNDPFPFTFTLFFNSID